MIWGPAIASYQHSTKLPYEVNDLQQTEGINIMAKYRGPVLIVAKAIVYAITATPRQNTMMGYMVFLR